MLNSKENFFFNNNTQQYFNYYFSLSNLQYLIDILLSEKKKVEHFKSRFLKILCYSNMPRDLAKSVKAIFPRLVLFSLEHKTIKKKGKNYM